MSHFTTIATQVRDLDALRAACAELGLTVLDQATARGYARNAIKAAHVIRLKGPYDIAVNRQADGTYALTTDWWNGYVEREVGKAFGLLLQRYGLQKAEAEARRHHRPTRRVTAEHGVIRLIIGG